MSNAVFHSSIIGCASIRMPVSKAMISASAEECDTAVCFLHNHATGTQVCGPAIAMYIPLVDLESLRSPAKLASVNIRTLQSEI